MLFEDFVHHVEDGAVLHFFAHFLHLLCFHDRQVVAERLVHVGDDRREFVVIEERAEAHHWGRPAVRSVLFTLEVEGSVQTFQHDFNDAILVALEPLAVGESGVDVVNAASVRLVAGDAVCFAVEHFFSEVVGLAIGSRELLVGWAVGLVGGGAETSCEEGVTGDGFFTIGQ